MASAANRRSIDRSKAAIPSGRAPPRAGRPPLAPKVPRSRYAELIPVLKRLRIKVPRGTKKSEVVEIANRTIAAMRIQRAFRAWLKANDDCPITMEPIAWPFVSLKVSPLQYTRISLAGIAGMLNVRGNMRNPLTRQDLTCEQIDACRDMVKHYTGQPTQCRYPTAGHQYRYRPIAPLFRAERSARSTDLRAMSEIQIIERAVRVEASGAHIVARENDLDEIIDAIGDSDQELLDILTYIRDLAGRSN